MIDTSVDYVRESAYLEEVKRFARVDFEQALDIDTASLDPVIADAVRCARSRFATT